MQIGASSACFYPLETEKALERVAEAGFKTVEIFLNTPSELAGESLDTLTNIKCRHGLDVTAVHPFMSFAEGYCLFSTYRRRYDDFREKYKAYYNVCEHLGAKIFVLHGAPAKMHIPTELYCERFCGLSEDAESFGVTLAQENIVHYHSQSPNFLLMMKKQLGNRFKAVLDIKQAYRAGYSPESFLDCLRESVVHIHVSDHNSEHDCLAPGEGNFDFGNFFLKTTEIGYNGAYIIELYNDNFSSDSQLVCAAEFLEKVFLNK